MTGPSPVWNRPFAAQRRDRLTRALVDNLADTNAQFQPRRLIGDAVWERISWGVVIVGLVLGLFWVLKNAPASLFHL